MKNKKMFFMTIGTFLTMGFSMLAINSAELLNKTLIAADANNKITISLDESKTPSSLTDNYQDSVSGTVSTPSGNPLTFTFVNAKKTSGKFVELAPRGMIYNFAADSKEVKGLCSVKFIGTGTVSLKTAKAGQRGGSFMNDGVTLTSGDIIDVPTSSYFHLVAGDDGAVITSLDLTYTCNSGDYSIDSVAGTFTGKGNDGFNYELNINSNRTVRFQSLDKIENIDLSGTAEMVSASQVALSLSYQANTINYTLNASSDMHSLTFVSKSGAALDIAEVNFNRVYNVQDFESYTETGLGYDSVRGEDSKQSMSGLRSDFYCDYKGSNTVESPIGGSDWSLMGSLDYLSFNSVKGHNSTKTGVFKGNSNTLRYLSMNSFFGVPEVIGKGNMFSFWANGPWANGNFNSNASVDATVTAYLFTASKLTPSNVEVAVVSQEFTIKIGSNWQEYTMIVDENTYYFGFGFLCKQSGATYTAIDDIKIYTVPTDATSVSLLDSTANVKVGETTQLMAEVFPSYAEDKTVSWSSSNTAVATVSNSGLVTAHSTGITTITVTTNDGGHTDTCLVSVYDSLNYPEGTFSTSVTYLIYKFDIIFAFGDASNSEVVVLISNTIDAEPTGIAYNSLTHEITIPTEGILSLPKMDDNGNFVFDENDEPIMEDKTIGTITGTYDISNDRLTNVSCDGDLSAIFTNLTATRPTVFYGCDGSSADLQSKFVRRTGSGSPWTVDTTNNNRLTHNGTNYISGKGAMTLLANPDAAVTLNLANDFATAKKVKNIGFWVYNPSAEDIQIRMWVYKAVNYGSNAETGSVTAKANGWSYCQMGFSQANIYNFQISIWNHITTSLTFDNIILF